MKKARRYTGAKLKKLRLKPATRRPRSQPKLRAKTKLPYRLPKWSLNPNEWEHFGSMETAEYLAALKRLGLTTASQRTSMAIGHNVRQCQRFANGDAAIPAPVARLLRMYLKFGLPPDILNWSIGGR